MREKDYRKGIEMRGEEKKAGKGEDKEAGRG